MIGNEGMGFLACLMKASFWIGGRESTRGFLLRRSSNVYNGECFNVLVLILIVSLSLQLPVPEWT